MNAENIYSQSEFTMFKKGWVFKATELELTELQPNIVIVICILLALNPSKMFTFELNYYDNR